MQILYIPYLYLVLAGEQGIYRAHPMPTWSEFLKGSSEKVWYVDNSYSLSATFFLQQDELDEVVPVPKWQASACIYKSAIESGQIGYHGMAKEDQLQYKERLFDNAYKLARLVPSYNLKMSLNGSFWKEIEKVI